MQRNTQESDGEIANASLGKSYTCEVCSADFCTEHVMRMHQESHPGFEPHPCGTCKRRFANLELLKSHQKWHTERKHRCPVCEKTFLTQHHLWRHQMHKHMKQKSSQGGVSGKRLATKTVHDKSNNQFRCHICDKSMASKASLRHHVSTHSWDRPHRCNTCEKTFKKKAHLLRHERRHFRKFVETESNFTNTPANKPTQVDGNKKQPNSDIVGHPCPLCDKRFNTELNAQRHQLAAHASAACPLCAREFPGAEALRFHLFKDHTKGESDSAAKRPLKAGENISRSRSELDLNEVEKDGEIETHENDLKTGSKLNNECIDLTSCSSDDDLEIKHEPLYDLENQHGNIQQTGNFGDEIKIESGDKLTQKQGRNGLKPASSEDDVSTSCGSDLEDAAGDLCSNSTDQVNTELALTCKICEKPMSCRESLIEHERHHLAMRQLWLESLVKDEVRSNVSLESLI